MHINCREANLHFQSKCYSKTACGKKVIQYSRNIWSYYNIVNLLP